MTHCFFIQENQPDFNLLTRRLKLTHEEPDKAERVSGLPPDYNSIVIGS